MSQTQLALAGERKNFSRIPSTIPLPNLIAVQRTSYEQFLQMDLLPEERTNTGLRGVLERLSARLRSSWSCPVRYEPDGNARAPAISSTASIASTVRYPYQGRTRTR